MPIPGPVSDLTVHFPKLAIFYRIKKRFLRIIPPFFGIPPWNALSHSDSSAFAADVLAVVIIKVRVCFLDLLLKMSEIP